MALLRKYLPTKEEKHSLKEIVTARIPAVLSLFSPPNETEGSLEKRVRRVIKNAEFDLLLPLTNSLGITDYVGLGAKDHPSFLLKYYRKSQPSDFNGIVDHELIHALKLSRNDLVAANCLSFYLETLRQQRPIPTVPFKRGARRASSYPHFRSKVVSHFMSSGLKPLMEAIFASPSTSQFAEVPREHYQKLFEDKKCADHIAEHFAHYAAVREMQAKKPGFGLMLLKLATHGYPFEVAEDEIESGAHDAEIKELLRQYWPDHRKDYQEFVYSQAGVRHPSRTEAEYDIIQNSGVLIENTNRVKKQVVELLEKK